MLVRPARRPSVRRPSTVLALLAVGVLLAACSKPEDEPNDPNDPNDPGPSAWLVGEQGEMLRLTAPDPDAAPGAEPSASTYPLEHDADLRAIACTGRATAWVVGDAGTVLLSRDAGQTWRTIAAGTRDDLHAVAVAERSDEGAEVVWLAGDAGTVLRSTTGGQTWQPVAGTAVDLRGVATDETGQHAWAVGLDGSVWSSDDGVSLRPQRAAQAHALYDVAVDAQAEVIVAVGEAGRVLHSHDFGLAFAEIDAGTELDLHAVQVVDEGRAAFAVGAEGLVLHIDLATGDARPQTIAHSSEIGALWGLHLRADGTGQAVGAAGVVLTTTDGGRYWTQWATDRARDLFDVDDFHAVPHD